MGSPLRITPGNGRKRLNKAERRMVRSVPKLRWAQRCVDSPKRKRLLGAHWRWAALGQWYLVHEEPPKSLIDFLSDCDFLGIDWAVNEKI